MAVSVVADRIVLPTLIALRDSLIAWWAAQPLPVKVMGLRWGNDYSAQLSQTLDEACPGICWVRFVSVGDSRNFPATGGNASPCGPPMWAVTVEIGVQRCAQQWPGVADEIPTDAQWAAIVTQASADMAVVRQAVRCAQVSPAGGSSGISWGTQAPLPVDGNVTGSTIQVTVPVLGSNDCMGC